MIRDVRFTAGKLVVTDEFGHAKDYDIANYLRAADIPAGLTYTQVQAVTALANIIVVLIRTLIVRQVLDESFMEDEEYSLDDLIESIEGMGGAYHEPDITVES